MSQFPAVDGERSTSAAGRAILSDALRAAGRPPAGDEDWRAAYLDVLRELTEHDAPGVAAAGLASVHAHLVQVRDGRGATARRGARRDSHPRRSRRPRSAARARGSAS